MSARLGGASSRAGVLARAWIPALLWTALILGLGSDGFSSETTGGRLVPLLRWLFPSADEPMIALLHKAIRKTAHATEYGVFALLALRAFRVAHPGWLGLPGLPTWHGPLRAVGLALLLAALDEGRQVLAPNRSGSALDVLLDVAGAAGASVGWLLWTRRRPPP